MRCLQITVSGQFNKKFLSYFSVADPDQVFGPPVSSSQMYGSRSYHQTKHENAFSKRNKTKKFEENYFFVGVWKGTDEKSRIRIR
jgi:hypothetical protein